MPSDFADKTPRPPRPSATHLVLIPSYNTGAILLQTVTDALKYWAPVWVVVDGSTDGSAERLEELAQSEPNLRVIRQPTNQGKGAAVYRGAREALENGFTHILCMDSDGQHPAPEIPEYMASSELTPGRMILGNPVFDHSAPTVRVLGRELSNFWANLETMWCGIGDSLFGMRVYPAKQLVEVMDKTRWARRFDFDPEVAVRLIWHGVRPVNVNTPVRYLTKEEGGVSHFHYFRDNVLLSWMHARLVLGALFRLPKLLTAKWRWKKEDVRDDPDSESALRAQCRRISRLYDYQWFRVYSRIKLKTDPLYEGVYEALARRSGPILDLGCGLGLLAFYLKEKGLPNTVYGVDYDEGKIRAASKIAAEHYPEVKFFHGDLRQKFPPFQGNVAVLDILQFFKPDEQKIILQKVAQCIMPGGILIIRNALRDDSWRFRVTAWGDSFARWTFWMKASAVYYPEADKVDEILRSEGLVGEFRPLWGKTPFNNYLILFRRPVTSEALVGSTQQ